MRNYKSETIIAPTAPAGFELVSDNYVIVQRGWMYGTFWRDTREWDWALADSTIGKTIAEASQEFIAVGIVDTAWARPISKANATLSAEEIMQYAKETVPKGYEVVPFDFSKSIPIIGADWKVVFIESKRDSSGKIVCVCNRTNTHCSSPRNWCQPWRSVINSRALPLDKAHNQWKSGVWARPITSTLEQLTKDLCIQPGEPLRSKIEKMFCAAVLAEGTEVANRILNRYLAMRSILLSENEQPPQY